MSIVANDVNYTPQGLYLYLSNIIFHFSQKNSKRSNHKPS